MEDDYILPPLGVYAVKIEVDGTWFQGICNVGFKPTFKMEASKPSVEVHILHFENYIYGQKVKIEWQLYLRKEQKFSGVAELVNQLEQDKQHAIEYFQRNRHTSC
jgi:riboflavin kinase/FMN adenylyltransferase